MFGVTIGIAALFSMITFGQFARDQILAGFEELGANAILIRGWPNDMRKATDRVDVVFQSFDWDKDLAGLSRVFPTVNLISPLMGSWDNSVSYGGRTVAEGSMVWGISADFQGISKRAIVEGGPMSPMHVDKRSPVCLIGGDIRRKLFRDQSPVGQILFLSRRDGGAYPCRVLGVLADASSNMDWRKPNLDVVVPFTYLAGVGNSWEALIHSFVVQVAKGNDVERAGTAIRNFFYQKYGNSGEFRLDANTLLLAQIKKSIVLFTLLLSAIAVITLAVGGMGINNMMLVSLAERFKEIGLCKALGATDRSLRVQFLLESTMLSSVAGLLGILAGFSAYELIIFLASKVAAKVTFTWIVDPTATIISLVSVIGVGIASGMVPALKAERLSVIEALRSE